MDIALVDFMVTTAMQAGPKLEIQAEELVNIAAMNGLDDAFLTTSRSRSLTPPWQRKKRAVVHVPDIKNSDLLATLCMVLNLRPHEIVDELCRRMDKMVDHQSIRLHRE